MKNNKLKIIIISVAVAIVIIAVIVISAIIIKKGKNNDVNNGTSDNDVDIYEGQNEPVVDDVKKDTKVDIVDINSKSRPYAVVINNTPVAVKVQEGLNRAYLVYEIPTEGNTSRLLALYKDIEDDLVIGTIRSARHNFIDFALESDAIFCCFGWSHYAKNDMQSGFIDYLQGLAGYPFYRDNKENLALEHTAYTSMSKLKDATNSNGFRKETDKSIILNYDTEDVDLEKCSGSKVANSVVVPYGASPQIAKFVYDETSKMYTRYEDSNVCVDHNTKENVTTKNIIIQKIGYNLCLDHYYWDLRLVGSGEGYYITCGRAIKITWSKESKSSKTKYCYAQGTIIDGKDVSGMEISVSDGRTWIEVQTKSQNLTIE